MGVLSKPGNFSVQVGIKLPRFRMDSDRRDRKISPRDRAAYSWRLSEIPKWRYLIESVRGEAGM